MNRINHLLIFNLATDANDPMLGFTTTWINALADYCAAIDVVTMTAGRLSLKPNVRVFSVGKEKGYSEPRRALEFYRILVQLLAESRYDACFAHMMPLFAVMGAPLLKAHRVPITLWYTHKSVTRTLRLAEKLVNHVVTASPESFRIPSSKVVITGHGIDTDLFSPTAAMRDPDAPFTIVSVGRIAPVKRIEVLIEAARILRDENPDLNFRIRIVGEASPSEQDYARQLRASVTRNKLDSIVDLSGGILYEQVADAYRCAKAMVNTSHTGSIDKAVLEAMACGLPVITSNEAYRAILAPWAEVLFAADDSPEMLARLLRGLMALPAEERRLLGLQLRQIVIDQHSLDHLIEQLMRIFTP